METPFSISLIATHVCKTPFRKGEPYMRTSGFPSWKTDLQNMSAIQTASARSRGSHHIRSLPICIHNAWNWIETIFSRVTYLHRSRCALPWLSPIRLSHFQTKVSTAAPWNFPMTRYKEALRYHSTGRDYPIHDRICHPAKVSSRENRG